MAPGPAVVPSEGPGRLAFEKGARAAEGLAFTALVGVSAYPGVILLEAFSGRLENPAFKLLLVLGWECSSLWWVIRNLNFAANERHLTGFALGLLVPLFVSGLMANFPVELVLVEDLTLLLFFRRLFRLYPSGTAGAGTLFPLASSSSA